VRKTLWNSAAGSSREGKTICFVKIVDITLDVCEKRSGILLAAALAKEKRYVL